MAIYYKFRSARDFDSISIDGPFITLGSLKEKIFESKRLSSGTDFDLVVANAQTNEEYVDEATLISKNTSVLIRRVPGRVRMPIFPHPVPKLESKSENSNLGTAGLTVSDISTAKNDDSEWDEFGTDPYSIPETLLSQPSHLVSKALPVDMVDEDCKIKALIDTPALDWNCPGSEATSSGRGTGRGVGGRMLGRNYGMERRTPPPGYICHRCRVPGHFIQHCPTNGDPTYDIKRVIPPTGIPKSMLIAAPDGAYALPSGAVAVLKPNEADFEKEVPATRSVGELPPELHCPLCKEVMKDAVLTSRCCFNSFCDKCIRNYILSNSSCICGAKNILADDLLPNKTLRDTINHILESGSSSTENAGSACQIQDMESAHGVQPKVPSPSHSSASKECEAHHSSIKELPCQKTNEPSNNSIDTIMKSQISCQQLPTTANVAESTNTFVRMESASPAKKKKRKKVIPPNDMPNPMQDPAALAHMMPMPVPDFGACWTSVRPRVEGYLGPYNTSHMQFMNYVPGPYDMPCGTIAPPNPFPFQACAMPIVPPQGVDFSLGLNIGTAVMSREEFEAKKADLRQKRNRKNLVVREQASDDTHRDAGCHELHITRSEKQQPPSSKPCSSSPLTSRKSTSKSDQEQDSKRKKEHRHRSRDHVRPRDDIHYKETPRHGERKHSRTDHGDHDHDTALQSGHQSRHRGSRRDGQADSQSRRHNQRSDSPAHPSHDAAGLSHKGSVFSRISYPVGGEERKRKRSSRYHALSPANGCSEDVARVSSAICGGRSSGFEDESSDDDRHFKRRPSRFEPSPTPSDNASDHRASRGIH